MLNRFAAARRASSIVAAVDSAFAIEGLESRRLYSVSLPHIGDVLSYLANDFSTRPAAAQSRSVIRNKTYTFAKNQPNSRLLVTSGDTVLVKAASKVGGTSGLAAQFTALGATVTGRYGRVLTAAVPVSALAKVNSLTYLQFAKPSYKPYTKAGKTEDHAVQAITASVGGKDYGVDGTGVTVGILSDSYNNLGTASTGVANGDLPSGVNVLRDLTSADNNAANGTVYPGTDEGRGMAEIVHDVAPGAGIAFYSAFLGEPEFATGILSLAKPVASGGAGAKVVVDDIGYFDEPYFQDGIVAQAVNTAASTYGTSYFSAAGNSYRSSYEKSFLPAAATVTGGGTGTYMDFDTSATTNVYQQIVIPAGGEFTPSLQWDQPFYSASTNAGGTAGSANSLSMYLLNSAKTTVLTSETTNVVGADPSQILDYVNPSSTASVTVYLAIKVASGANPGLVKYIDDGSGDSTLQFATNSGTSVGHPVASGGLSVGAANYDQTPAYHTTPAVEAYYSSAGGTPILFASDGTRLATAQYRNQPAITSVDGGATSFFGQQDLTDFFDDGQYHFYGTSAAAPHAAAVAALMLQAKPSLTNTQVYSTLETTAIDMGTVGYDYDTGFGLIQADKALAAVAASSVSGTSFRDYNGNGVKDAGEPGLSGTKIFFDANNNGTADTGSGTLSSTGSTAITDASAATNAPSRVTNSITSALTGRVTGLTVSINASHTRTQQLGFTLITPGGVRIPLVTTLGGFQTSTTTTSLAITLSDAAGTYVQSTTFAAAKTGTYIPQTPLAAAIGENATGTWQMEVRDYKSSNTGTLTSWSMTMTTAEASTTTDANGNYTFTGLTPSVYYGTYRVRQTTPAGLTQTSPSSPFDLTLARSSTITGDNFGSNAPIPTVAGIVLDDGTAQRSRVRSLTVTFNGTIPAGSIAAGAFTVSQISGPVIQSYTASVASVTAIGTTQTAVKLTFSGAGVVNGSVADGRYTLSIDGSKITDTTGAPADAAGTNVAGSIRTYNFSRLSADADGNNTVDFNDFLILQNAFNTTAASPNYNSGADNDGNGAVDFNDFLILQNQFNHTV
ncbi:MAG: hypothetical protein JWM57_3078 [Phycisphaerales bacterium]|nr:hypothetical protein [Phycisphaerales bacterium]